MHIAPGEALEFVVADSSAGQLHPGSTVTDVDALDFSKVNPVTGPVFIEGAEPGDVLKVTLLSFAPSGWGWTANIPGFGLLAEEFKESALHLWTYDATMLTPALFGHWARVPLKPFTGTIGVAPAEFGTHSVVPPRRVGGNHPGARHRGVMIAAHLGWLAALLTGAAGMIATAIGRRRRGAVY